MMYFNSHLTTLNYIYMLMTQPLSSQLSHRMLYKTLSLIFFMKYLFWFTNNCIIINPIKSNFLCFNTSNIAMQINGHATESSLVAKYFGVCIDEKLSWSHHVNYITRMCCQRIGLFKNIMWYLPNDVLLLYYNSFIRSCFSYCLMFW